LKTQFNPPFLCFFLTFKDMWVEIQGSEFKLNATLLELNDIDIVSGLT